MKVITILQPWASLIACGVRIIETRSWATKYRGPLAIHAGKQWPGIVKDQNRQLPESIHKALCWKGGFSKFADLPLGSVIAVADLVDCIKVSGRVSLKIIGEKTEYAVLENGMKIEGHEFEFGDFTYGRYAWAWLLTNVRQIDPVPAKGKQRLWEWEQ